MEQNNFFEKINNAKKVLIGIGKGFFNNCTDEELVEYYNKLAELLREKDYFVISLLNDNNIKKSNIDINRVTLPLDKEMSQDEGEKQWNEYTKWLLQTLNRELLILELGVGFEMPTLVRWPFEKIAMLNNKAYLYRVNENFPQLPEDIGEKGEAVKLPVGEFLDTISTERFGN